eukprot:4044647-Pyramimonas_sp.AAC.1
MPLDTKRSLAFDVTKGNGKKGVGGRMIMRTYCSMGMGWHRGIHRRAPYRPRPVWAQGGLAARSRGNALICLLGSKWRAEVAGVSIVVSNYDCTNAFA